MSDTAEKRRVIRLKVQRRPERRPGRGKGSTLTSVIQEHLRLTAHDSAFIRAQLGGMTFESANLEVHVLPAGELERLLALEQRVDFLRTQVADLSAAIDGKNVRIGQMENDLAHLRSQAGPDSCADYVTRNADQEKRIAELTEALKPFAGLLSDYDADAVRLLSDDKSIELHIALGDMRRAAAALNAASAGKEG